jgi:hypothetical protein
MPFADVTIVSVESLARRAEQGWYRRENRVVLGVTAAQPAAARKA